MSTARPFNPERVPQVDRNGKEITQQIVDAEVKAILAPSVVDTLAKAKDADGKIKIRKVGFGERMAKSATITTVPGVNGWPEPVGIRKAKKSTKKLNANQRLGARLGEALKAAAAEKAIKDQQQSAVKKVEKGILAGLQMSKGGLVLGKKSTAASRIEEERPRFLLPHAKRMHALLLAAIPYIAPVGFTPRTAIRQAKADLSREKPHKYWQYAHDDLVEWMYGTLEGHQTVGEWLAAKHPQVWREVDSTATGIDKYRAEWLRQFVVALEEMHPGKLGA